MFDPDTSLSAFLWWLPWLVVEYRTHLVTASVGLAVLTLAVVVVVNARSLPWVRSAALPDRGPVGDSPEAVATVELPASRHQRRSRPPVTGTICDPSQQVPADDLTVVIRAGGAR